MRTLALVTFATACSFSNPDLTNTQFRCDASGACPDGETCRNGACVVATHDGVACTTPCDPGEQCCNDLTNPPRCIAATESCLGISAVCDGREDCPAGSVCCSAGSQQRCATECSVAACQTDEDCPSREPNCCPDPSEPQPWKLCSFDPC